jgi:hypothetical protein
MRTVAQAVFALFWFGYILGLWLLTFYAYVKIKQWLRGSIK